MKNAVSHLVDLQLAITENFREQLEERGIEMQYTDFNFNVDSIDPIDLEMSRDEFDRELYLRFVTPPIEGKWYPINKPLSFHPSEEWSQALIDLELGYDDEDQCTPAVIFDLEDEVSEYEDKIAELFDYILEAGVRKVAINSRYSFSSFTVFVNFN